MCRIERTKQDCEKRNYDELLSIEINQSDVITFEFVTCESYSKVYFEKRGYLLYEEIPIDLPINYGLYTFSGIKKIKEYNYVL